MLMTGTHILSSTPSYDGCKSQHFTHFATPRAASPHGAWLAAAFALRPIDGVRPGPFDGVRLVPTPTEAAVPVGARGGGWKLDGWGSLGGVNLEACERMRC